MSSIVPGADQMADAEEERRLAEEGLGKLRAEAQRHVDVEVAVLVRQGSPAREIVALAQRDGFDLIVMGTHGQTWLQHVLMGSVAEAVVRRAECPVLTIHLPLVDGAA